MEGHGIKRGLTAVEAAVLMQQPMDKIFTMILFGLLKKGAAEVVTKEPLELKISTIAPLIYTVMKPIFWQPLPKKMPPVSACSRL